MISAVLAKSSKTALKHFGKISELKNLRNMSLDSTILLSSGHKMPIIGIGTCLITEKEAVETVLTTALDAGCKFIDTAFGYMNQHLIGESLKKIFDSGKVKREDLFIVDKLPNHGMRREDVEYFFKKSAAALQVDYIDLYLIHSPISTKRTSNDSELFPFKDNVVITDYVDLSETWKAADELANVLRVKASIGIDGNEVDELTKEAWDLNNNTTSLVATDDANSIARYRLQDKTKAMESLVHKGYVRSIGLSNFNSKQIQRIYDGAEIKPSNLQVECHVYLPQHDLQKFCKSLDISFTANCPLGTPNFPQFAREKMGLDYGEAPKLLEEEKVKELAQKYQKSPAQILLRYLVQRDIVPIPKSVIPARIKENLEIFDFVIDEKDMESLGSLENGFRYIKLDFWKGMKEHPEYPFHIPF